ncbi:MAG TPA: carboxypeptidase-like regulatory domain-containing protein [Terracidiphilus sp.]|nr:carboxypeptidase-like regulatory domain-containing protein [Terracidiphilus sp.]
MHSNNRKQLLALCLVIIVGLAGPGVMLGQGTNGSLTGQITDPADAAIPNAAVTLTNLGTNLVQTENSDSSGVYLFKLVPPGTYSLRIAASGFADYLQSGIVINANLYATQNVHMKIGTAGQTVSVTAEAALINTTSAELGMTVNQESVTELPLNGRDPSTLALLAPGMVDGVNKLGFVVQGGFAFPTEQAASANGGRVGSTYYMLDGVSNMDNYDAVNSPTPNPDATQEFRLISSNFSAVYGFSPGGVVSMATRSGSNQWHGGLFEFLRNQDLNAKNWNNKQLDPLKRNTFGGYFGGPALKNKLFFFFNYQGRREVGVGSANATTVPTQQMLNGDFSGLVTYALAHNPSCAGSTSPSCGYLYGPFKTVNGVPNQLIGGAAALDQVAVQFTNDGLPGHTSAASGTGATPSSGQNLIGQMYYNAAAIKDNYDEYTARVDYDLSKDQRITLRSFVDELVQPSGDVPGNVLSVLNLTNWNQGFGEKMWYLNEIAQHTWTVNPTTVNTATILWTQQSAHNAAAVKDHSGKNMCWSRYIEVTEISGSCYMEGFSVNGFNGGWTEPSQEVRGTMGFSDTFIKTIHRHTISAGMDLMKQSAVENTQYPTQPIISFGGGYTGNGMADWLLGYMSGFTQGAGEIADIKGWQVNPYVNDEFRVIPGLTLTLGLRWDPDLAPTSVGGRGAAFVVGQQSTQFPNAPTGIIFPGDKGMNAQLRPSNYGYWEPRVGVAYQPKNLPRTSFHAGFGLFTGPVPYSSYNHVADVAPFSAILGPPAPSGSPICYTDPTMTVQTNCAANSGQAIAGYMNFQHPWKTSSFGTNGVSPFPPFASIGYKPPSSYNNFPANLALGASFSRNYKAGITEAWNVSAEHQISPVMAVRLAYVGSESYHQSYIVDDNRAIYCSTCNSGGHGSAVPYSNFGYLLEQRSGATASFNSLQATFDRHLAHGLQAQSSFTWQKTIDVASSSNISFGTPELDNPFDLRWNRGISSLSIPFTWTSNFVYQTPRLKGQSLLVRELVGGWELSPIITLQSGTPFSIQGGNSNWWNTHAPIDATQNGTGSGCKSNCPGDRADRVAGQPLKVRQGSRSQWVKQYFNPAAFVPIHDGTFGTSGRNLIQGPPSFNIDSSLMKNWSILEKYQVQFRFELFNAFNHPVMGNPDTWPNDFGGTLGQINAGAGSAANASRIGQAALKFSF